MRGWRGERYIGFLIGAALCSAALFGSWFWLAAVTDTALKDVGQGGAEITSANVLYLGTIPTFTVQVIAPLVLIALGVRARRVWWSGILIALALSAAASLSGAVLAQVFFAPVNTVP